MARQTRSRSVRILAVFRPSDPDAITVLRLQAAVNDLGTLHRMILHKKGTTPEINATYRYALRMSALHLHAIRKTVKDDLPRLAKRHFRRRAYDKAAKQAAELSGLITDPRLLAVIGIARQKFAGHYDRDYFRRALALIDHGDLMELPGRGVHMNVCDILFDQILASESHREFAMSDIEKSVEAALNAVWDVQERLLPVVNALVFALYADAEGM